MLETREKNKRCANWHVNKRDPLTESLAVNGSRLFRFSTNQDYTILDPFCGIGASLVVNP